MTQASATGTTAAEVLSGVAGLEDPKARAVNEKHGDDHGVNLGKLLVVAKRLKTQADMLNARPTRPDCAPRIWISEIVQRQSTN